MSSIDGLIALCTLLTGFGIILGVLNEQNTQLTHSIDSIKANSIAKECGAIIDSVYSNSASEYNQNLACGADTNKVTAHVKGVEKEYLIIPLTQKNGTLEVKTNPHYYE